MIFRPLTDSSVSLNLHQVQDLCVLGQVLFPVKCIWLSPWTPLLYDSEERPCHWEGWGKGGKVTSASGAHLYCLVHSELRCVSRTDLSQTGECLSIGYLSKVLVTHRCSGDSQGPLGERGMRKGWYAQGWPLRSQTRVHKSPVNCTWLPSFSMVFDSRRPCLAVSGSFGSWCDQKNTCWN